MWQLPLRRCNAKGNMPDKGVVRGVALVAYLEMASVADHMLLSAACLFAPVCRPQLARGLMQLFSIEQQKSQPLEAHAAAFSTVKVRSCRAAG